MESINTCNKLFAEKTLHPLASVIDMSTPCPKNKVQLDCYCIMVLENYHNTRPSTLNTQPSTLNSQYSTLNSQSSTLNTQPEYGLRSCDFKDGTLIFNQPTKVVDIRQKENCGMQGRMVLFHPSLLIGTPLGKHISSYTFFKYRKDEALHVSASELRDIDHIIDDIERELHRGIDEYSATILSNNIELLLNYCLRFYHRQFIMRHDADDSEFKRFKSLVDHYMTSGNVRRTGMPCGACRFTSQMDMSAAYLSDLVRNESGKSVTEYAQLRRIELAKQMIIAGKDSDAKIALMLGYANVGEFRKLFEKLTGVTTDEYRNV